ncbi:hypothetical protein D3C76_115300 [compost metagenome]
MKKQAIIFWFTILMAAFGVVAAIGSGSIRLGSILIPIIIFAVVFLLYKFPPKKFQRGHSRVKVKPSARTMAKIAAEKRGSANTQNHSSKRKHYPFQVIDGQKGKNDEDYPKYH